MATIGYALFVAAIDVLILCFALVVSMMVISFARVFFVVLKLKKDARLEALERTAEATDSEGRTESQRAFGEEVTAEYWRRRQIPQEEHQFVGDLEPSPFIVEVISVGSAYPAVQPLPALRRKPRKGLYYTPFGAPRRAYA